MRQFVALRDRLLVKASFRCRGLQKCLHLDRTHLASPLSLGRGWWHGVVRIVRGLCRLHDERPHGGECGNHDHQLSKCGLPRRCARVVSPCPRFSLHLSCHVGRAPVDVADRCAPMHTIVGALPLAHIVPPRVHVLRIRSCASRARPLPPRTPWPRG